MLTMYARFLKKHNRLVLNSKTAKNAMAPSVQLASRIIFRSITPETASFPLSKTVLKDVACAHITSVFLVPKDTRHSHGRYVLRVRTCMEEIHRESARPFKEIAQSMVTALSVCLGSVLIVNKDLLSMDKEFVADT